jgi:hypothetical protein
MTVCERCGQEFECGAESKTCWCFAIEITDRDFLSEYDYCVCRSCLEEISAKKE